MILAMVVGEDSVTGLRRFLPLFDLKSRRTWKYCRPKGQLRLLAGSSRLAVRCVETLWKLLSIFALWAPTPKFMFEFLASPSALTSSFYWPDSKRRVTRFTPLNVHARRREEREC